jgi:hypothetical protein
MNMDYSAQNLDRIQGFFKRYEGLRPDNINTLVRDLTKAGSIPKGEARRRIEEYASILCQIAYDGGAAEARKKALLEVHKSLEGIVEQVESDGEIPVGLERDVIYRRFSAKLDEMMK